jgi:hypothetical protein
VNDKRFRRSGIVTRTDIRESSETGFRTADAGVGGNEVEAAAARRHSGLGGRTLDEAYGTGETMRLVA